MNKERFSLLLLEPGEIYFEDVSVFLCPETTTNNLIDDEKNQLGRLKVCSKSLVFDPKDLSKPLVKLPLKDCSDIKKHNESHYKWLTSRGQNALTITCNQYIEMLEGNILAPYKFRNAKRIFIFLLNYTNVDVCVRQISQLHSAATLPIAEQNQMIAAIERGRQLLIEFNPLWFEDLSERIVLEIIGNRITPLVVNPGRILLSNLNLYFQPFNKIEPHLFLKIPLKGIKSITKRRFLLRQVGLELCCKDAVPSGLEFLYLVLNTSAERDKLFEFLMNQQCLNLDDSDQGRMTLLWQNGVLSNYDYLLFLNSQADRTFNDLTQYPVFPWVIADYSKELLDLNDESVYRDLRKPVGALNKERLDRLKDRFRDMPQPRFLYGSHYSTPGFVLFYLVRKYPHFMLCLQNGRFDHPDRMFNCVASVWRNVLSNSSDFKELVPEFYDTNTGGDFLLNAFGVNFGTMSNGSRVGDVVLPPWAKDSKDFVLKLRNALESDYVSKNLNHWIDLIFGYKQSGKNAEEADNLFYYLCYEGAVDLDSVTDFNEKHSLEVQIMEFGQIPKQIFDKPHPQRNAKSSIPKPLAQKKGMGETFNFELKQRICAHKDAVTAVLVAKEVDSTFNVFSVGRDAILKIHSLSADGACNVLRSAPLSSSSMALSSIAVLHGTSTLAVGCWDSSILMYDIECGRVIDQVNGHEDAVSCLLWCDQKNYLISASWDCCVRIWHIPDTNPYKMLKPASALIAQLEHDTKVTTVAISCDNECIASGTDDGEVLLWSLKTYTISQKLTGHLGCVNGLCFNADESKLVSCSDDASFKVYDTISGMEVFFTSVNQQLKCLCLSDNLFVVGGSRGTLFVWDFVKMTLLQQIDAHKDSLSAVAVFDNGENFNIVTGSNDRRIILWQS
ncbi:hypothetical protein LSTR_LSTR004306 [Laodelphax striatellus]|uniref:WD repeat-containing protein 55 homolog n=1 Tax=Laodelphax striatellus TaxID=195883 RepID=A0A482X8X3_LAOST|nr:hypothetical protein LSTR_LSTR004306 [Laodelphax striatellus]